MVGFFGFLPCPRGAAQVATRAHLWSRPLFYTNFWQNYDNKTHFAIHFGNY